MRLMKEMTFMKKPTLTLLCFGALFLASCGGGSSSQSRSLPSSDASSSISSSAAISSFPEVSDSPVASGDYLKGSTVYRLDKENKKLKIIDFEGDYAKYKSDQGTPVNEYTVKFVQIDENAVVYYEVGNGFYYLVQEGKSVKLVHVESGSIRSTSIAKFPTLLAPTYGNYVSTEAFTQNKLSESGERLSDDSGNPIKETFYLFLELSETSAKLFVGGDNQTHREQPLHFIENYTLRYNAGGTCIQIPHQNGEFKCTLNIMPDNQIDFNNAWEKDGDYSAAGTFVLASSD